MNFLDVEVKEAQNGKAVVGSELLRHLELGACPPGLESGALGTLGIRPQYVSVSEDTTDAALIGEVILTERLGTDTIVDMELPNEDRIFEPGRRVGLNFPADQVHYFDERRSEHAYMASPSAD